MSEFRGSEIGKSGDEQYEGPGGEEQKGGGRQPLSQRAIQAIQGYYTESSETKAGKSENK